MTEGFPARGCAAATHSTRKAFRQQLRTRFVVLHQHQIRVVSFEAILHALEKLHLDLNTSWDALLGQHFQCGERRFERQDAVDDDRQPRLPSFRELSRQRLKRHRVGKHSFTFREYCLSGRRQPDAIAIAVEQLETELPLELSQLVADG